MPIPKLQTLDPNPQALVSLKSKPYTLSLNSKAGQGLQDLAGEDVMGNLDLSRFIRVCMEVQGLRFQANGSGK